MLTKTHDISAWDDIIDVRDVIARIEDLENDLESTDENNTDPNPPLPTCDVEELNSLVALMAELKGNGGDEQWKGDWYPITLIRDSYFEDYAQELAEDCAPFSRNSAEAKLLDSWPYRCIDWQQAARELQHDYSSVEFDGVTYWYR